MARKKHEEEHENLERWLLTYADLITLLLAFFIIMYSMSKIDAKKFGAMAAAFQSVLRGGASVLKGDAIVMPNDDLGAGPLQVGDLKLLEAEIKRVTNELKQKTKISTEVGERGLIIHITESALFQPGKAYLTPGAMKALDVLAEVIRNVPNDIRIEGHSDDTPIHTAEFPSNWELSTARATQVVRYLIEKHNFSPVKISAMGYAEYRPLFPNDTPENRAKNRRVDIIILSPKKLLDEPYSYQDVMTRKKLIRQLEAEKFADEEKKNDSLAVKEVQTKVQERIPTKMEKFSTYDWN
jgi:chemotaxis protein MotB